MLFEFIDFIDTFVDVSATSVVCDNLLSVVVTSSVEQRLFL